MKMETYGAGARTAAVKLIQARCRITFVVIPANVKLMAVFRIDPLKLLEPKTKQLEPLQRRLQNTSIILDAACTEKEIQVKRVPFNGEPSTAACRRGSERYVGKLITMQTVAVICQ
jgi:hypothetical protein